MVQDKENVILVNQLQVGVYVYLDVGWMHHPFSFNNFKIRNEEQLATIRQLGLKAVRWDPARSDVKPLDKGQMAAIASSDPTDAMAAAPTDITPHEPPAVAATGAADGQSQALASPAAADAATAAILALKLERRRQLAEHSKKIAQTEVAYTKAANMARGIDRSFKTEPGNALQQASRLIGEIVDELVPAPDLAIQVISGKPPSEEVYFHSLNVSVLAMILARELKLPPEVIRMIGIGGLFHDIGLSEIPDRILMSQSVLAKAEREFREQHCQYGFDIGKKVGLPPPTLNIILQHHEHFDGSGYPKKLKGDQIDLSARLVAVVNTYDNLCNPVNIAHALTPHDALAQLFAQQRNRFDPRLLQAFIRFMGVYPPGTIVGLSNDVLGLVIKTNSARPLKPIVILYDEDIPKNEAVILDLNEEPDINITRAIRPGLLPKVVFDYLSPRRRVSYYFDAEGAST